MKILFFSVQQGILVHSVPEAIVARSIIEMGHEVSYVTCNTILSDFCVTMSAHGLTVNSSNDEKVNVCKECIKKRDWITGELGVRNYTIEDFIEEGDLVKVNAILSDLTKENIDQLEINTIPIGRYAAYEFVISHKLNSLSQMNDELFFEYKIHLKNALIISLAAEKVLRIYKPDVVLTYNNFYSANHAFTATCDLLSIDHYTIHGGHHIKNRLNTLYLTKKYTPYILLAHSSEWENVRQKPNTKNRIKTVAQHFFELFKGQNAFVYSSPIQQMEEYDLFNHFNIEKNQKVILLILTSGDERFAASLIDVMPELGQQKIYNSQMEWVKDIIDRFTDRTDVKVILRPHPREFPNKRENVKSKQAELLTEVLDNLPVNFHVNWPSDNISIYDIAKIVDVCLPSTSSSGFEMASLGAPVVTFSADNIYAYPADDITISSKDREEYYLNIEVALNNKWSLENSRMAFRWGAFKYCDFDINLKDVLRIRENREVIFLHKVRNKLLQVLGIGNKEKYEIRLPKEYLNICRTLENSEKYHIKEYKNGTTLIKETKYLRATLYEMHRILKIKKINFRDV
jgi:hypothetical protein